MRATAVSCHGAGVDAAIRDLAAAGFDLAHAFDPAIAAREPGLALIGEALADAAGAWCGLLVGNTRALWPPFVAARAADPALAADPNPLQRYTERCVEAARPAGARVYYAHQRYGGAFVPFQRLAVATGLGALAPSHLVIHPEHGPWFALRAVIVAPGAPPVPPPSPIARACRCDAPCHDALAAATAARGPDAWRAWLAVRDACTLRAHRYSDDQIRYHYTRAWPAR